MPRPMTPFGTARRVLCEPTEAERFAEELAVAAQAGFDLPRGLVVLAEGVTDSPEGLLLATLLLIAQRQGSTRIPIAGEAGSRFLNEHLAQLYPAGPPYSAERLAAHAQATSGELFVYEDPWLSTRRDRGREQDLARVLVCQAKATPTPAWEAAAVDEAMTKALQAASFTLSSPQRQAIQAATTQALTVISGGPGTGKTSIVRSLLRVLTELGVAPEAIALAAPTGKAAKRLTVSIGAPEFQAKTLHRLLGYSPSRQTFRHGPRQPLAASVVIVDEASMIDLELMTHLAAALPPGSRLVLLGDHQQLPSVSTGTVLRDVLEVTQQAGTPLSGLGTHLTESYRQADDEHGAAVEALAASVNSGAWAPTLLQVRDSPTALTSQGTELLPSAASGNGLPAFLAAWLETRLLDQPGFREAVATTFHADEGAIAAAEVPVLERLLAIQASAQLLSTTRVRPTGSLAVNRTLHRQLCAALGTHGPYVPGDKVMVTTNDYERGLFNGDLGVVVRVKAGPSSARPMAVFRQDTQLRAYSLGLLDRHLEPAHAITVHKAQGSEYDVVGLVLPHAPIPLLTREILYTAITRARSGVILAGREPILRAGTELTLQRHSGLADLLRSPPS